MNNTSSSSLRRRVVSKESEPSGDHCGASSSRCTFFVGSAEGGGEEESQDAPFVPEKGFYQPSTEETWEAYQALITLVEAQSKFSLSRVVLCGVADEVLSVLNSNTLTNPSDKKAEIEKILRPVPDFIFNQLVTVGKLITDYYVVGQIGKTDDRAVLFAPEKDFYQPKSDDTYTAYKLLLDVVNDQLPWQQPQSVQCVLAHEVLKILNDVSIQNWQKKLAIESSLHNISDETFDLLLFIGDLITDFGDILDSGCTAVSTEVSRNEYLHQPNPIPRPLFPGFQYDSAGQVGQETSHKRPDDSTDDDETVNTSANVEPYTGTELVYSSDDERVNPKDDETPLLDNTEFVFEYSSDDESDNQKAGFDVSSTDIEHVYSRDDTPVEPTADENASMTNNKGQCSSDSEAVDPSADVNTSLTNIALQYSSDDESVNPTADSNSSLTGSKRLSSTGEPVSTVAGVILSTGTKRHCSSIDEAVSPKAAAADGLTPATKLEYSSEEETIYFNQDKSCDADNEDEEGWVKIDYDEDGL